MAAISSLAFARNRRNLLQQIFRYPIKSLHGEPLGYAEVTPNGLAGDRVQALLVESGHTRIGKPYRGKEDRGLHRIVTVHDAISAAAKRAVALRVESGPDRYFDDSPISLILAPWLADAERICERSLDVRRFRPNLFAEAMIGAEDEASLVGEELAIGAHVRLRVTKRIERCVVITYDQESDAVEPSVLRALAKDRDAVLGVYCEVLVPGFISVGDSLARV